eukprot:101202_1
MNHKVIMPDIGIPMAKHPHSNNCPFRACIHSIFFYGNLPDGPPTLYACLYSIGSGGMLLAIGSIMAVLLPHFGPINPIKLSIRSATIPYPREIKHAAKWQMEESNNKCN